MPTCSDRLAAEEAARRQVARAYKDDLNIWSKTQEWPYHGADGKEVFTVIRFDKPGKKDFRPIHETPSGWAIGDPPDPLPLYRLPGLAGKNRVFFTEGEKSADQIRSLGLAATTAAHGSNGIPKPGKNDFGPLAVDGLEVVILPDHDEPGAACARKLARSLLELNPRPTVKIVRLADKGAWLGADPPEEGDDVVDWVRRGVPEGWDDTACRDQLLKLAAEAAPVTLEDAESETEEWPPLKLATMPAVTPFPIHVFPWSCADYAKTVANAINCPIDYVALPILVVVGAMIGRAVKLRLKPGYLASTTLYGLSIGGPTAGKSPALEAVARPVQRIDRDLHDAYEAGCDQVDRDYQEALELCKGR